MRFLTCEPLGVSESQAASSSSPSPSTWTDEADQFFEAPEAWLKREYGGTGGLPWPSHLVYFSSLHRDISALLVQSGYKMCGSFFHTHFPEGRVGASVLVSCR
ncbi:mannosyltransferase [Plakobranchus ocellatus]|uniref:Mannosyltransferase n=1 Tax=Plakobranchus ocellatus TaxID=259542 RepID=A0AAV3ZNI9_9GAST|nr:mannosyltransferase [Plakobranchus ocellatus]